MKIKIYVLVQFFLIRLLGLGCSQLRRMSQNDFSYKEKHLKTAGASSLQDSSATKLIPFREKAQIFWTCVGVGTVGGMVIGAVIGSSREPDHPSDDSGLATMVGMIYGSAIGCGAGAVVGILVAAKDGVLLLNDEASEEFWKK